MSEQLSYVCPFCASEVRVGKPCGGCSGKVKKRLPTKRSWEQDSAQDGLDLPNEDFDYEEFVGREFGKVPHRNVGLKWYWWVLAIVLLCGMMAGALWP